MENKLTLEMAQKPFEALTKTELTMLSTYDGTLSSMNAKCRDYICLLYMIRNSDYSPQKQEISNDTLNVLSDEEIELILQNVDKSNLPLELIKLLLSGNKVTETILNVIFMKNSNGDYNYELIKMLSDVYSINQSVKDILFDFGLYIDKNNGDMVIKRLIEEHKNTVDKLSKISTREFTGNHFTYDKYNVELSFIIGFLNNIIEFAKNNKKILKKGTDINSEGIYNCTFTLNDNTFNLIKEFIFDYIHKIVINKGKVWFALLLSKYETQLIYYELEDREEVYKQHFNELMQKEINKFTDNDVLEMLYFARTVITYDVKHKNHYENTMIFINKYFQLILEYRKRKETLIEKMDFKNLPNYIVDGDLLYSTVLQQFFENRFFVTMLLDSDKIEEYYKEIFTHNYNGCLYREYIPLVLYPCNVKRFVKEYLHLLDNKNINLETKTLLMTTLIFEDYDLKYIMDKDDIRSLEKGVRKRLQDNIKTINDDAINSTTRISLFYLGYIYALFVKNTLTVNYENIKNDKFIHNEKTISNIIDILNVYVTLGNEKEFKIEIAKLLNEIREIIKKKKEIKNKK